MRNIFQLVRSLVLDLSVLVEQANELLLRLNLLLSVVFLRMICAQFTRSAVKSRLVHCLRVPFRLQVWVRFARRIITNVDANTIREVVVEFQIWVVRLISEVHCEDFGRVLCYNRLCGTDQLLGCNEAHFLKSIAAFFVVSRHFSGRYTLLFDEGFEAELDSVF